MSTNTSISTVQKASNAVIPKPTKAQLIELLAQQVVKERQAENDRRGLIREKLKEKMDKAIERFKKKSIKIRDLEVSWKSAGMYVHLHNQSISGSPEMQAISNELKKVPMLSCEIAFIREDVKKRLDNEMMSTLLAQPGVKEAILSTINKLGLV